MPYPPELEAYRERFEGCLENLYATSDGPPVLLEAMAYSLFAGGKRIRPVLLMATFDLFSQDELDPMPAACALEFIHTYSLIHDDLPAMDDDDLRRGQPTNHKRYGEAVAILAGDGLLTEAFGLMSRAYARIQEPRPAALRALAELATAAGSAGMVGGQVLDMEDTGHELSQTQLESIHRMKTGALLVAAVRCGAILAGAKEDQLTALTRFGRNVGLAFQVADDLLDVLGTRESIGKSIGKDQAQGKTTYVDLLGTEGGQAYVHQLTEEACSQLAPFGEKARPLEALARFIAASVDRRPN